MSGSSYTDLPTDIRRLITSNLLEGEMLQTRLVGRQAHLDVMENDSYWLNRIHKEFLLPTDDINRYRKMFGPILPGGTRRILSPVEYYKYLKTKFRRNIYDVLNMAVRTGRTDLVKVAILKGASPKSKLETSIDFPIGANNLEMTKLLLDSGVRVVGRRLYRNISKEMQELLSQYPTDERTLAQIFYQN